MRVTRIFEAHPGIISAKVSYASQLAKVKAKDEMCIAENHKKLHFELQKENYQVNLEDIHIHPRVVQQQKQKLWKKIWNFFSRKDTN